MRKGLSFVVASALSLAGAYFLYLEFFEADHTQRKGLILALFLLALGLGWLWGDFIGPALGRKTE